ncbi:MAG: hypothetical protein MUE42_12010 [Opitutaceae bacterium]|nr:hypothetical protein [Opitutaceae bacterium]
MEVVLLHGAAVTLGAERGHAGHAVARVGGGDGDLVAEFIEGDLLFDGVGVFAGDGGTGEVPLHLDRAKALLEFFLGVDQLGLFVAEEEAVAQAETGDGVATVERGNGDLIAEGELGREDGGVDVVGPVEDAGRVGEGQGVGGDVGPGAHEGNLGVEAGLGVLVEEEALLLAGVFVEDDKTTDGAGGLALGGGHGQADGLGEARPLAEVAGGVEVGHARGVVRVGGALGVAEIEEAVLLVEVGLIEENEEAAEEVEILGLVGVGDPAVAQTLKHEGDAVHLTVNAGGATEGPAEAIGADEVGHHLDVFLGVGAEGGELAVAHAGVGVELERGADEHEAHHAIEVEVAADAGGGVVKEAGGAGGVNPIHHALDEAGGLVLLREAEGEAGDSLGDVECLPVVVVVGAVEEGLVDALAGLVHEAFPDRVALLGGAEAEEAEGGVGEAVFRRGLGEHLGGDATGGEVDQVVALERGLAGGAVVFAEGEGDVAGLVGAGFLAGGGKDGSIGLDGVQVVAQHRTGHIETLLGEAMHA